VTAAPKLERCPFCGGECVAFDHGAPMPRTNGVECRNDEGCNYISSLHAAAAEAIAAHNQVALAVRLFPTAYELMNRAWQVLEHSPDGRDQDLSDEMVALLAEFERNAKRLGYQLVPVRLVEVEGDDGE
jgi:hypothetical protein